MIKLVIFLAMGFVLASPLTFFSVWLGYPPFVGAVAGFFISGLITKFGVMVD